MSDADRHAWALALGLILTGACLLVLLAFGAAVASAAVAAAALIEGLVVRVAHGSGAGHSSSSSSAAGSGLPQKSQWFWLGRKQWTAVISALVITVGSGIAIHHFKDRVSLTATCSFSGKLRPGNTIEMTYNTDAPEDMRVALGAGIYSQDGTDQSTGIGDEDDVQILRGQTSKTRPVPIPGSLVRGTYELVAEIYPSNKIGTETLADPTCQVFTVP